MTNTSCRYYGGGGGDFGGGADDNNNRHHRALIITAMFWYCVKYFAFSLFSPYINPMT